MSLEVKGLYVTIGDKIILENADVTFSDGKITSVIGPNGAGKSTLLRAASGINEKIKGQVLLDGRDIHSYRRPSLAKKIAVLPQSSVTPSDITVEQLVDYGRFPYRSWLKKSDSKEDREAVEWAMEATRINLLRKRQVSSLSGGERQRAWIAMALAQKPEILFLDEPTTYLDIAHQLEVLEIIRSINKEWGMTIIMVMHDLNQAARYSHELVVVKDKSIYQQGSPDKVLTKKFLADVFRVRAKVFTGPDGGIIFNPVSVY